MARKTVALSYIEHDGEKYNYGDVVPQKVIDAHPTAVGAEPLTEEVVAKMSAEELRKELLFRRTGQES